MQSIQEQIRIVRNIIKTPLNDEQIIETLKRVHPLIVIYCKMTNNVLDNYIDRINLDYFHNDLLVECVDIFIELDDVNFIIYAMKEFKLINRSADIIQSIIMYYIDKNDINSLKLIRDEFKINNNIVCACIENNYPEVLKMFVKEPYDEYDEGDVFYRFICSKIMYEGDYIDLVKVYHEHGHEPLDNSSFNHVFNCALVFGREICMHYSLNNTTIDYFYEDEPSREFDKYSPSTVSTIYPFTDTIIYAIIGQNMNCIQTVFAMFMDKIKNENWEHYFKFASVYGSLEIIKYMITIKPYIVDLIDNFYNNILKFALCEGNLDIVIFAINNGATYSNNMLDFANEYNSCRESYYESGVDDDYTLFYEKKYLNPYDIEELIEMCMQFIYNN